jgi:L-lysine 2,3-aminomutase
MFRCSDRAHVPVVLPYRITEDLITYAEKASSIVELTPISIIFVKSPTLRKALAMLADAGIPWKPKVYYFQK